MIQVINGEIKQFSLPKTGTLKNGRTVSGYDLLDITILEEEGWLPLEDIRPLYDVSSEYLQPSGYTFLNTKVVKNYEIKRLDELPVGIDEELQAVKMAIKKLIRVDELSQEELDLMVNLYEPYVIDTLYLVDDIFRWRDNLYKVIQEHTSQEDWLPSELPALYLKVVPEGVVPEWVQPTGGHDAYNIGDKVIFEGKVYESTIDSNTWSPTDYPSSWKSV